MAKWPKSTPWKSGKRKDWTFENGYEISAFKYPGSKGFKENKWEILILFNGYPVDPTCNYEYEVNILDDYTRLDRGKYGYLHDPDVDRVIKMIRNLKN